MTSTLDFKTWYFTQGMICLTISLLLTSFILQFIAKMPSRDGKNAAFALLPAAPYHQSTWLWCMCLALPSHCPRSFRKATSPVTWYFISVWVTFAGHMSEVSLGGHMWTLPQSTLSAQWHLDNRFSVSLIKKFSFPECKKKKKACLSQSFLCGTLVSLHLKGCFWNVWWWFDVH